MQGVNRTGAGYARALGAALRAVRKHRCLDQTAVAAALGISRRSYIDLEAGAARLSVEQAIAFADITDSDRLGLAAAALLDRPEFAVQCADNKLMTIMMIAADDSGARTGANIAALRPQELLNAFNAAFDQLGEVLTGGQASAHLPRRPPSDDDSSPDD